MAVTIDLGLKAFSLMRAFYSRCLTPPNMGNGSCHSLGRRHSKVGANAQAGFLTQSLNLASKGLHSPHAEVFDPRP